jgi:hypothetical protein
MANDTYIIYEGPSLYDGAPIVVLVQTGSSNRKTGDMVQTYILRSDIDPITASRTGKDSAICGTCPHMGTPNLESLKAKPLGALATLHWRTARLANIKPIRQANISTL